MEKILSIIVPTFNMEKFLGACLSSFVIEEILEDIEVIIINDGSTDSSAGIANEYTARYDNFILINKENAGHGSTINVGINIASAKYFKIVDADDYVEKSAFIDLVETLKNTTADLVLSNFYWRDYNTGALSQEREHLSKNIEYYKIYKSDEILDKIFLKMHSYTIKTEILKKMNLKISENCFYVDLEYISYPIPYINTILFTNKFVYIYNIGIANQSISIKNMQKRCDQHEKVLNNLLLYYDRYKNNEITKNTLAKICSRALISQYKIYFCCGNLYKEKLICLDKKIKNDFNMIYQKSNNNIIKLLRLSKYNLYDIISFFVKLKY